MYSLLSFGPHEWIPKIVRKRGQIPNSVGFFLKNRDSRDNKYEYRGWKFK
jgi:hypothetical protein